MGRIGWLKIDILGKDSCLCARPYLMNPVTDPLTHGLPDSQVDFSIGQLVYSLVHLANINCGLLFKNIIEI